MVRMRWVRVLGFAAIYFSIYVASAVFATIASLRGSAELEWYLKNPLIALLSILGELIRSPLMILTLLSLLLSSFALGLITDWLVRILERRIRLRKRKQVTEINI